MEVVVTYQDWITMNRKTTKGRAPNDHDYWLNRVKFDDEAWYRDNPIDSRYPHPLADPEDWSPLRDRGLWPYLYVDVEQN